MERLSFVTANGFAAQDAEQHSGISQKVVYRAEIDGLRAIAVLSVIFYHAQLVFFGRDWFTGGFLGVDIFFVISGYLITRIILIELHENGSFSFLNFYERRARRILPLLFLVIFASFPYAWQKLPPSKFVEFIESIIASLFFGSNFFFYYTTTEYGADSALLKPFLHTWSLGIEEQFYFAFPFFALIMFRYFRSHFMAALIAFSLLSLLFADQIATRNSELNFYLPFSRLWELGIGSVLAFRELANNGGQNTFWKRWLPTIGIFLIAYSILFFDDKKTPHPSLHTIIPILGVALIIRFSSKEELVGKVLRTNPFVSIGLISYSAYMWHFPIFAFSRLTSLQPPTDEKLIWILATLVLSVFSYYFVERPFRNKEKIGKRPLFFSILFSYAIVIVLAAPLVAQTEMHRSDVAIHEKLSRTDINYAIDKGGFVSSIRIARRQLARNEFNEGKKRVLVVGNSLAQDLVRVLHYTKYAKKYDFLAVNAFYETGRRMYQIDCFYRYIKSIKNKKITRCGNFEFNIDKLYDQSNIIVFSQSYTNEDARQLDEIIPKLKKDGKTIVVVSDKFRQKPNLLIDFVSHERRFPGESETNILEKQLHRSVEEHRHSTINVGLKELSLLHNIRFLDDAELYCDFRRSRCNVFTPQGYMVSFDDVHLTESGAKYLAKVADIKNWFSISK